MTKETGQLRVDIVSDIACPWCVIGYYQMKSSMERTGISAVIHWHPFEINPQIAEGGENLLTHLVAKYGTTRENISKTRARLAEMGAELGFAFNYTDEMRINNTFRAHQLIHWAQGLGRAHELKLTLFETLFTHCRDLSDPAILAEAAEKAGLDREEALAVLADHRYAEPVRKEERSWIERGVQGVPTMIFAEQYLATGAQGVENYASILRQLARNNNVA